MISNCGHDENGQYSGGQAGDQTGGEYTIRKWYDRPWTCILRYPDKDIASKIATLAVQAANNRHIGYDQNQRLTFWEELKKVGYYPKDIQTNCEADCSSSSSTIVKAVGHICNKSSLASVSPGMTSSTIESGLRQVGFHRRDDSKYLKSDKYLLPGDILVCRGHHVAINVGKGAKASTEDQGVSDSSEYGVSKSLYSSEYTRDDGVGREFGYLSIPGYTKTIARTSLKLSVLNYTSLLGDIAELFGYDTDEGNNISTSADTSGLKGKVKTVVDYLINKGFPAAGACGIAGNIYYESNFNTACIGDNGTSFGICQWHNTRGQNMKKSVSNWKDNLTGQLDFLVKEMKSSYEATYNYLKNTEDTEEGCKDCADYFVRNFEKPAKVDEQSKKRQAKAAEYYDKIVIESYDNTDDSSSSGDTTLLNRKGKTLKLQKTVTVPSRLKQSGLVADYTNYVYFFSIWTYTPRTIADIWAKRGKKRKNGIATIGDYYLVAVTSTFGSDGDVIKVYTQGGHSFAAIVADMKNQGDADCNKWGHVKETGTSLIEWEAIGPKNSSLGCNPELGNLKGKKVLKIENYGSYL